MYSLRRQVRIEGSYLIITSPFEEVEKIHFPQLKRAVTETNTAYRAHLNVANARDQGEQSARESEKKRFGDLEKRLGL